MLVVALAVLGACAARHVPPAAAAGTTRNVEFVQKLKEDLRRNNDDYILGRRGPDTEPPPARDSDTSAYVDDVEEVYRRALLERGTQQVTIRNRYMVGQERAAPSPNMIRETSDKLAVAGFRVRAALGAAPGPVAVLGAGAASHAGTTPGAGAAQGAGTTPGAGAAPGAGADPGAGAALGGGLLFRANRAKNKVVIPSPDQLDMAPARGKIISSLRQKNRLCQRHVLIPEGPKYDSRGRVYLRAHPPHAARPYASTRFPRLLLPRCCNCCKKSVLGCE